jgi:membrane associated rhomboid family serine protease
MQILAVTVGVYIVQIFFPRATEYLLLPADWFRRPWEAYRLVTYGLLHDPQQVEHILFNMLVLFFFGKHVENRYGRTAFLTFYLSAVVLGGLAWTLTEAVSGQPAALLGASAATTGVFLLFALNYPRVEVRLMFVFPMPAWVAALICVGMDVFGAVERSGNVAFTAHLGGALFAWTYYRFGWLPGKTLVTRLGSLRMRSRPKLRVHKPAETDEPDDLSRKVDQILQKIQEKGQDSLSWNERRLLEKASRQYQQKRK